MIDHTGLQITDPARSRRFYDLALAPLGYAVLAEIPTQFTGGVVVLGYGVAPKPDFWVHQGTPNQPRVHVAFRADTRQQVDAFYQAALAAGAETTALREAARITISTITARSCWIPTATTSKRFVTPHRPDRVGPARAQRC